MEKTQELAQKDALEQAQAHIEGQQEAQDVITQFIIISYFIYQEAKKKKKKKNKKKKDNEVQE